MNVRRGYRRLSIAVVGIWVVAWACIGGFAAWQQGLWTDIYIEASRADKISSMAYANEHTSWYGKLIALSLLGEAAAVPLAILLAIGWWVYRGFSANPSDASRASIPAPDKMQ
jgi:hypothetical protein